MIYCVFQFVSRLELKGYEKGAHNKKALLRELGFVVDSDTDEGSILTIPPWVKMTTSSYCYFFQRTKMDLLGKARRV